jgi:hypothetical protein
VIFIYIVVASLMPFITVNEPDRPTISVKLFTITYYVSHFFLMLVELPYLLGNEVNAFDELVIVTGN